MIVPNSTFLHLLHFNPFLHFYIFYTNLFYIYSMQRIMLYALQAAKNVINYFEDFTIYGTQETVEYEDDF